MKKLSNEEILTLYFESKFKNNLTYDNLITRNLNDLASSLCFDYICLSLKRWNKVKKYHVNNCNREEFDNAINDYNEKIFNVKK